MNDLNHAAGGIQSVDYLSQILELFCAESGALTLKEIAQKLDESPAKVFRYLVSLIRVGLLTKTDNNEYEIGQLALNLSFKALNRLDPLEEACRTAQQMYHDTHYGVAVSIWGAVGPTVIKTYEPQENLYSNIRAGSVMSLRFTSSGRTFAKYLPEHILKETLAYEDLRYLGTKMNAKERQEFVQAIQNEKDQLLTFMWDKSILDLSSISIPVFNISQEIQFVITIFQQSHLISAQQTELERYLIEQVRNLSRTLGLNG